VLILLSRNTGKRGYRHKQANRLADERHQEKNKAIKLTDSVKNYISEKLKEFRYPTLIIIFAIAFSIFLMLMAQVFVKCSAYRFVLQDKAVGGFSANFKRTQRWLCHSC
jgi:IS30 family transposase